MAANDRFQKIRGAAIEDSGDYVSALHVDGARCRISGVDGNYPSHECYWILSKDQDEAKSIFEQMVIETSNCVENTEPPSRYVEKRGANVTFLDGPKIGVKVSYYFYSGWYRLDFEYTVYDE
ncbi:hypothetical protein [Xanthobacter versatilis]|uniref:hypothetical protein n=1 Tax=Xanthobacter autotrophicus (strain ATCC BAA-1158 / Py2) TaxID=78245 RepID=UPI00372A256B